MLNKVVVVTPLDIASATLVAIGKSEVVIAAHVASALRKSVTLPEERGTKPLSVGVKVGVKSFPCEIICPSLEKNNFT
ncbi:hypothetical protein [Intestinibacter sp.]|uniref:hypothetical protein n=1 Tax=Intestinibacter sp. TaxID=1965304 RepID=UPI003F18CBAB